MKKTILITGGTGYIGSHGVVKFLENNYEVIIVDNLSNSNKDVIQKIQQITNKTPIFYKCDIRDKIGLEKIFLNHKIDGILHFAGAKAVGESCVNPFYYYENNVLGSLVLFELMDKYLVKNIIFSSSATVYMPNKKPPFIETDNTGNTTNPYGTTKFLIENILRDLSIHKNFNVANLRYFNPIGAHNSGLIGENPNDIPNNLLPFILKVATGELNQIKVFGNDYNTIDGTGVRDYIHVEDLIDGHLKAYNFIENISQKDKGIFETFNLGTGTGTSVLEIINIASFIIGKSLPYSIVDRRPGDLDSSYCNPDKAIKILNWQAKYDIKKAIKDSWNFIQKQK